MTNPQHHVEIQEFVSVGPDRSLRGFKAYCSCNWDARTEYDRDAAEQHARRHLEQAAA